MPPAHHAFGSPFSLEPTHGWASRLMVSVGMAGLLALMGSLSFPLPWTPVPFSMMPLGLLIAGGYQRPMYGFLSVGMYLAAGALGAPIYAEGASGAGHLFGNTAGYLWGFLLVSPLIGWYLQRPRRSLGPRATTALLGAFAVAVAAGTAAIAWTLTTGRGLGALRETQGWGVGSSALWYLAFLTVACITLTAWTLQRRRGETRQALELYLVMLGSIVVLHACGVAVLWASTGMELMAAVILGSVVFLPFDAVKAGLAVGLTLPFLPTPPTAPDAEVPHA